MESGDELQKETESVPDEQESWVAVEEAGDESEAAIVVGFLESLGIPARIMDKSFHQTPAQNEDLIEIEVAVPASRVAEAEKALADRDEGFKKATEGEETVLTEEGLVDIDVNPPPEGKES